LHIRWAPPPPHRAIQAIAVDNEPEPFWDGEDQLIRIEAWQTKVSWQKAWGTAAGTECNGSSGRWVREKVLAPLKLKNRSEAWITDCLDTYRFSDGAMGRVEDTYNPFAQVLGLPLVNPDQNPHPGEDDIVAEAAANQQQRLLSELNICEPELIVTLGNAALRVIRLFIVSADGQELPESLAPAGYGNTYNVRIGQRACKWLPLAHPNAPGAYQDAHAAWIKSRLGD